MNEPLINPWIFYWIDDDDDDGYECGDCGKRSDFHTKFCPHCGIEKINYKTI